MERDHSCSVMGALGTPGSSGQEAAARHRGCASRQAPAPQQPAWHPAWFCMGEVSSGGWPEKILRRKVRTWENAHAGFVGKPGRAGL